MPEADVPGHPRAFTVDDIHAIAEPVDCTISLDGLLIAFVTKHANVVEQRFEHAIHLKCCVDQGDFVNRWSSYEHQPTQLCFSPNSAYLAFVRYDSDYAAQEIVLHSTTRGWTTVLCGGLQGVSCLRWAPSSDGLFFAADEPAEPEQIFHLMERIVDRLPWWHTHKYLSFVALPPTPQERGMPSQLLGHLREISRLCVSPDGRLLAFTSDQADPNDGVIAYLHLFHLDEARTALTARLPHVQIGGFEFSPDGCLLAYVGSRVHGLSLRPMPLAVFAEPSHFQDSYGLNVYDARVTVIDLQQQTIRQLAVDQPLLAGVPVGISTIRQEIFWRGQGRVAYIATRGDRTVLVEQPINDDGALSYQPIGEGVSVCHSFAADGSIACFYSSRCLPFLPALQRQDRPIQVVRDDLQLFPSGVYAWQTPITLEHIPARSAWLYLPNRPDVGEGTSVPLVVYVYGGTYPLCRGFDDRHQLFAAHGYAVLVINPAGCAGFGPTVADAHVNDWGCLVVPEILSVVEAVLAHYPKLARSAIGVYGGSYGGFLAMLLARSGLFAAACSIAGISNIASYWGSSRFGYQYGLTALAGSFPWSRPALFVDQSPLFQAEQITAALLLIQGEEDSIVPRQESEQMFVAMRALGKTVALISFPGEEHTLKGSPDARAAVRRCLLAWFDRHLKHDPRAWDALVADGAYAATK